jgi:broad specificity phosphatase PhoE
MTAPLTLYLVRHGEVHNPQKVLYGRLPGFSLSETGRMQAAAVGRYLARLPITRLFTSPMERAQETAAAATAAFPAPIEVAVDERLNECLTPYQGMPLAELEHFGFEIYRNNQPPYETVADMRRRLLSFIQEKRAKHPGEHIAAFTHGDVLVVGFLYAVGQPDTTIGRTVLRDLGLPVRYPETASVLRLTFEDHAGLPTWEYVWPYGMEHAQNVAGT